MNHRSSFLRNAATACLGLALVLWPRSSAAQDFSKIRGVGLIDKQGPGYYPPGKYREADFEFLQAHGFNFVRLPIAYQFWTSDGNPDAMDEAKLAEIDQAVKWGGRYGQHVCLCFYSVPGYAINKPDQTPSLWTDAATQERFINYWRAFARRYKAVPPARLSFNLLNEPNWSLAEASYSAVMKQAIDAIREIDPARPIVVDGLKAGRKPVLSLANTGVVQAVHFYEPFPFTHHGAPWIADGSRLPRPERWPEPRITHHLFGPFGETAKPGAARTRKDKYTPLVIEGPFESPTLLRLRIGSVEAKQGHPLTVVFLADGNEIANGVYDPAREPWFDTDLSGTIPAGTRKVEIWVDSGIRLTFRELGIRPEAEPRETVLTPASVEWEPQSATLYYSPGKPLEADAYFDRAWVREELVKEWKPLLDRGGKVMVQEFGYHNQTPHGAALNYIKDCTGAWNDLGWGWAFWSLRGTMGIIDNGRQGIETTELPSKNGLVDMGLLRVLGPVKVNASDGKKRDF